MPLLIGLDLVPPVNLLGRREGEGDSEGRVTHLEVWSRPRQPLEAVRRSWCGEIITEKDLVRLDLRLLTEAGTASWN